MLNRFPKILLPLFFLISVHVEISLASIFARVSLITGKIYNDVDLYLSYTIGGQECQQVYFLLGDNDNDMTRFDIEKLSNLEILGKVRPFLCNVTLENGKVLNHIKFHGIGLTYDRGDEVILDGIYLGSEKVYFNEIEKIEIYTKNNISENKLSRKELSYFVLHATDGEGNNIGLLGGIPIHIYEDNNGERGKLVFRGVTDNEGKITFGALDFPSGSYFIDINPRDDRYYKSSAGGYEPRKPRYIEHPTIMHESVMK